MDYMEGLNDTLNNVNKHIQDATKMIENIAKNLENGYSTNYNYSNIDDINMEKWQHVFEAYKICYLAHKSKNDFVKAELCLKEMEKIISNIKNGILFAPNLLDDNLLAPYGGSQKLINEINNKFASTQAQPRINPKPNYGEINTGQFPSTSNIPNKTGKTNNNDNPYGFKFTELTEEDKLESYIKADLPVFLHGKSGCGKSTRIKEIDPDCEVIYLGSARPETLLGKSIVVNDELQEIPPTWYTKLCEKCKKEPDKDHILFFDEMTNATPALQSYAYNIILDKEINGKWKLPSNVKIVAAGNETKESLSANKLSEPLFRRFNHIYIETTLEKWLLWASKHNIHPAIYAYVASKGDDKHQVLRTECDGKNPCVDPRKWEMASKILYKSKNPKVLTATLGEKITSDFIEFCKRPVITLEQVLTDNYDHNMGRLSIDDGFATLIGLSSCNDSDIVKVRSFVKKYVIPDQYQNFVMMWTRGDKDRIDKIQELDLEEQLQQENRKR